MKKFNRIAAAAMAAVMVCSLAACGAKTTEEPKAEAAEEVVTEASTETAETTEETKEYVIGLCNYVDDASLNQIVENIQSRLDEIGNEKNVKFTVKYENCNADANVLSQIVANFIADDVDLMIGVATPVAMAMQGATEDNKIPVVFSAVSDPLSTGLVASMEAPGANITGTSDMLNTDSIVNMIIANNPSITKVGLLYDAGQDASTKAIADAKALLESKNIEVIEQTGTNVEEVTLAANALVSKGVEAVFTPTDNTVMTAELSIYEIFAEAGIPHFCGADSFALNGAFLGFGVNYADLGSKTADMAADILINSLDPASVAVETFDNGIVTVNEDAMAKFGLTEDDINNAFGEYASKIQTIKTAESFE